MHILTRGIHTMNIVTVRLTKRHKQHIVSQQTAMTFCNRNMPDSKKWTVSTHGHLQVNDCIRSLVTCKICLYAALDYYRGL